MLRTFYRGAEQLEVARMQVPGGSATPGAVLFSIGRFSEALTEYENGEKCSPSAGTSEESMDATAGAAAPGNNPAPIFNAQAVYAACNRAAAKLELEMCRSCLHDCDEAIEMDPLCLRAHLLKG